jgi:hypothetical protein
MQQQQKWRATMATGKKPKRLSATDLTKLKAKLESEGHQGSSYYREVVACLDEKLKRHAANRR